MAPQRATQGKPHAALVVGLLAGGAALLRAATSRSFVAPAIGVPPRGATPVPFAAESSAMRMEEVRGSVEPRTALRGRYPDRRSRKNLQGGKRLPIRVNRKPVLAYAKNDEDLREPGGSVLRRMWDMYDMDFERMAAERGRYFRLEAQQVKWTADYHMRAGRRRKERRLKRQLEEEWQQWMRTTGRKEGLTTPIVYNGPLVKMTPEEEETFTPQHGLNPFAKMDTPMGKIGWKQAFGEMEDMKPGRWNHDGTAELIFKIWRRPLHKHPFDIGRKGKENRIIRGNVL